MPDLPSIDPGMQGRNGVYWGWNPDVEKGQNLLMINAVTGKKASSCGIFSHIRAKRPYTGHQLTLHLSDIKDSNAVLVAHIMPTGLRFSQITPEVAKEVASVIKKFTDEGIEVWLRFAHEMNWYVRTGTYKGSKFYPFESGKSPEPLLHAWALITYMVNW
jgi:hypothetical protein